MYCMSTNIHKEMCGLYGNHLIEVNGRKYYVCRHHLEAQLGDFHHRGLNLPSKMAVVREGNTTIYINRETYEEVIVSELPFKEES